MQEYVRSIIDENWWIAWVDRKIERGSQLKRFGKAAA